MTEYVYIKMPKPDWEQLVGDFEDMCGTGREDIEILQNVEERRKVALYVLYKDRGRTGFSEPLGVVTSPAVAIAWAKQGNEADGHFGHEYEELILDKLPPRP